jgi:hypothetical protein
MLLLTYIAWISSFSASVYFPRSLYLDARFAMAVRIYPIPFNEVKTSSRVGVVPQVDTRSGVGNTIWDRVRMMN